MENEVKITDLENKEDSKKSFSDDEIQTIKERLDDVVSTQSKMVDIVKKTNDMIISQPNQNIQLLTESEKFVYDTITEFNNNPYAKWKYPAESKKFDVIIKYVLEGMDPKDIAKRYD